MKKMRFGVCADLSRIREAAAMGFAYLEVSIAPLAVLSEREFAEKAELAHSAEICVECCNILFPSEMQLLGSQADHKQIDLYLQTAFRRANALGAELVVFGSGKSRTYPTELSFKAGFCQLREVARRIGQLAGEQGITVALEPLNSEETNLIHTLTEGAMLAADCPNVELLADSYHMFREGESVRQIRQVGSLVHTHVALLENRRYPTHPDKLLREFFSSLREIGYEGRMSIEGMTEDFAADAPAALRTLGELERECGNL